MLFKKVHIGRFFSFASNKESRKRGILMKTLVACWIIVVLFADFLANDRPIICSIQGEISSPVLVESVAAIGVINNPARRDHYSTVYDWAIWPPIPFGPDDLQLEDGSYLPPGSSKHILGTDLLGRDLASGIIHGARKAFIIGILSMLLAGLIGVFAGAIAGYFGNKDFRMSWWLAFVCLISIAYGIFFATQWSGSNRIQNGFFVYLVVLLILLVSIVFHSKIPGKKIPIPFDGLLMRSVELLESMPKLLIILAVAAVWQGAQLWQIAILIGLLAWPEIARLIRGEIIKLKEQGFVDASKVLGLSDNRIIWAHLLPNAIGPVLITLAFGVGSAILLEAFLSFLGIGLAENEVTWGSMISQAREYFAAWWLAVFPGIALFLAILSCTLLAEYLQQRLDPKYDAPHYLD